MDICFFYGPPATGKFTVAQTLHKRFPHSALYHNHLAVDLVNGLFPREQWGDEFFRIIAEVHLSMIDQAIQKSHPGIIMTSCYIHPEEAWFVESLTQRVQSAGGRIVFVQLLAEPSVLQERIGNEDRAQWGKLLDPTILESFMEAKDLMHRIDGNVSLTYHTDTMTPDGVVDTLIEEVPDLFAK